MHGIQQVVASYSMVLLLGASVAQTAHARQTTNFSQAIADVVRMPRDADLRRRVGALGLNVVNVMWEDTARAGGSAYGPNISDLTLQVREQTASGVRTHLLPVIRHPNFRDKTGDIPLNKIWVRVGNHRQGATTSTVPLTEVLGNLRNYLADPSSLKGSDNFLSRKDTHFLVSAQHVFVPVPKSGKAEFNPVIFNYQSAPKSPAVMTLLVTREGLSATIIENKSGGQSFQGWGQQLFFNNKGQRTVFTAERRSDVAERIQKQQARTEDQGALEEGADMMMVVQVPLKHKSRGMLPGLASSGAAQESAAPPSSVAKRGASRRESDVERAVLGHGDDMGPFVEMGGLRLERDERFPIRVTVQFYRATSNGVVSDENLADVKALIDKVYADADYVGSLVVPKGERHRPTDWLKDHPNHGWGWRSERP